MKNKEKKQLLNKLKQIGNLDRKHRFSQKILKGFRTNQSHQSSFYQNSQQYHGNRTFNNIGSSSPSTPMESVHQILTSNRQINPRKQNSHKSRLKKQCKQLETQVASPNQSYYLSSRYEFTERALLFSKKSPECINTPTSITVFDCDHKSPSKSRMRCQQCKHKQNFQELKILSLEKEIKQLKLAIQKYEQKYTKLKKSVEPYINNVELMSAIVGNLADREKVQAKQTKINDKIDNQTNNFDHKEQLRQTNKINQWLLKQGKQKQKKYHNQSYRLKGQIDVLAGQNIILKKQIQDRDHKIKLLQQQLQSYDGVSSIRQRLSMCSEQLFTFKQKYQQKACENIRQKAKIDQMKSKINALTSLIGCAVIFDVQGKDRDQVYLKQLLHQVDSYQNLIHNRMDDNIFQYLKILKADQEEGSSLKAKSTITRKLGAGRKSFQSKRDSKKIQQDQNHAKNIGFRKLYYPNYLVLLGEESISAVMEHGVIKPTLFIKLRALLDSKYIDYRIYRTGSAKFSQFCNSFLKNYEIQPSQKKLYFINRYISQNQAKEINMDIIKYLMDSRIQDVPQIETFRDFMMGRYEEDQIYFYLMCRHKFLEGSELENYINSGDPSKFIRFDKAKRVVIKITQNFGRSIQNFICYHLNQRRILKADRQFIRLYYLLKLLLLVYRKIRNKKLAQMKELFDNVLQVTKKQTMSFMQFHELMRKNFEFLTRADIVRMYQTTLGILESQKSETDFFECFAANCATQLFYLELMKFDLKLGNQCQDQQRILSLKNQSFAKSQLKQSRRMLHKNNTSSLKTSQFSMEARAIKEVNQPNPINEIWPDSIYSLGNQRLTKQYVDLLNSNAKRVNTKIDILHFLLDAVLGHVVKQDLHLNYKSQLTSSLNKVIKTFIDFLNKLENNKLQHEKQVNMASRKLGKFFKNKIYQFYHEMLQDINHITKEQQNNPFNDTNNRNMALNLLNSIKMI